MAFHNSPLRINAFFTAMDMDFNILPAYFQDIE